MTTVYNYDQTKKNHTRKILSVPFFPMGALHPSTSRLWVHRHPRTPKSAPMSGAGTGHIVVGTLKRRSGKLESRKHGRRVQQVWKVNSFLAAAFVYSSVTVDV